jgi:cytidylate kinase
MAQLIVTIDGPAASGKSTAARNAAVRLKATFLDTGAMYRAVTFTAMEQGVNLVDESALYQLLAEHKFSFEPGDNAMRVSVDGCDISQLIRASSVTANARYIASSPLLRGKLVEMQRHFADKFRIIITEGRDQGTVVFPKAAIKIFLIANDLERARRRVLDLQQQGDTVDFDQVLESIRNRDESDQNRKVGPLKPAAGAITLDTTKMNVDQVTDEIVRLVQEYEKKEKG